MCPDLPFFRRMTTTLGLPGDLTSDSSNLTPEDWRVGGRVIVPALVGHLKTLPSCGVCARDLCLVSQVESLAFVFLKA